MKKISIILLVLGLLSSVEMNATDGYFMLGHGTISKGLGGTGVAYYRTSIIGGNPAGNAFLGKQYSIAAGIFLPDREYTIAGAPSGPPAFSLIPGTVTSDSKVIFVPSLGANWQINEKSAFGISIYGGGLSTNYPTATFHDPTSETTGVNLTQLMANPTYSMKLGEKHGIGLSAIISYQMFKADGLATFGAGGMSSNAEKLSGNGTDTNLGFGFKIGYMGEIATGFHVGATFQSRLYASKLKEYAGLFAEEGGFDTPANWTVGLNYELSNKLRLLFDVQQIYYSSVKSIGSPLSKLMEGNLLGTDDGPGFGWEDMTIFKLGAEYEANEAWIFRVGGAYGKQPIPESEVMFNILAPAVNETHLTLGLTKNIGTEGKAVNFALTHGLNNTVKGQNPLDPAQTIEIGMNVTEIELSFTF
ncbi:OmpP1/FadL family transporter [Carboxylicivirga sp. N1Y90]|uniref:OmpP1/FadL family transporter n=1 Tax=Carboxylicivirga fragile TaxID=3417571 RepID=UPI003D3545D8|nr:outer membrane protein transport protein [Marinilabiliaceae bacterium N1Y90]